MAWEKPQTKFLCLLIIPGTFLLLTALLLWRSKTLARRKQLAFPSLSQIFSQRPWPHHHQQRDRVVSSRPSSLLSIPIRGHLAAGMNLELWFCQMFGKKRASLCDRMPEYWTLGKRMVWRPGQDVSGEPCGDRRCGFCRWTSRTVPASGYKVEGA
jgi:hypothetical protein